jgi:Tol biopolymer transport system component
MDIWQMDLQSGEVNQLSNDDGYEGWPVWNRDASWIYYISGPEAARNVYRRKPGSNEAPERITAYRNASAMHPRISPESGQLTFTLMKDNHVIYTSDAKMMDTAHTVVRGSKAMLSPDGKSVYYIDNQPGRTGLWKVAINGDNPQQLVSGKVLTSYTQKTLVSPDGTRIAYAQYTGDTTTLFIMSSSGGVADSLYSADGVRHLIPSWSPDGKEIMFSIDGDLMVIAADGGDASVLASVKNWESWSLEWSPDGQSIAGFAYLEGEESNHIMLVDRVTKKVKRITPKNEDQYKEGLAWHPDGDRISYMYYNTEDSNGSRVVSLETSEISDLVDMPDPDWDYVGIWGQDKRFYFLSVGRGVGSGGWGLYAFDENKQEYQEIRQTLKSGVSLPSWSVDGSQIAWSEETPVRQIWMMTNYE